MTSHFMDTYKRTGLVFVSGQGSTLTSVEGRTFVDFGSGIGVNVLGHNHPRLVAAIAAQAGSLIHVCNYYNTPVALAAAGELCAATAMDAVFLCNSGAEANEGAIKLARKHGAALSPTRTKVITLLDSFHGRTIATLRATGQPKFHENFGPFPEGFAHLRAGDPAALDAALDDSVAAFMYEPIQGEGGVNLVDGDYLRRAQSLCRERGILLVADEIQSGMGRTGSFLASTGLGVEPDLVTLAKGLGGGLPIGAFLARGPAASVLKPGDHGSTFGGNPLAAAAARVVLAELTAPGFLDAVSAKGRAIVETIASWKHPAVASVRGRGLMIGVVVKVKPDLVKEAAAAEGLLVLTAGEDVVRLLPPLVLSQAEMEVGLERLRKALDRAATG